MSRRLLPRLAPLFLTPFLSCTSGGMDGPAAPSAGTFQAASVAGGLHSPTAMAFAPDGRLFVSEQGGTLRVLKNGALLATPFHTFTVDANGERGLLGVAFDPDFASNGFVYCYHTVPGSPAHNRVSRLHASAAAPDTSDGTDTDLLDLDSLSSATNHNGGGLHFGLDGKLYISVGENADPSNAQSKSNLLGKVLRMNSDGSVPADNPFTGDVSFTGKNKLIWAAGLRNPFTFAVQPGTGRLFINDVGSSPPQAREEINDGIAGSNYGWNLAEGIVSTPPTVPFGTYRNPLYAYDHSSGACAIAGGTFYNPGSPVYPLAFVGRYFYADLCGGWVHVFDPASGASVDLLGGFNAPVDVQVGPDGLIYVLGHGDGAVWKIAFTP